MRRHARILSRVVAGSALALILLALAPSAVFANGTDARTTFINTAAAQLGKPYVWAAAGPDAFDCSGLVQYCYAAAGISVPHQSGLIWSECETITADMLVPGDLVFRTNLASASMEPTTAGNIKHVAIYVGGGQVIEAPRTGLNVRYAPVGDFRFFGRLRTQYWPLSDRSYDQPTMLRGDFNGDGREDLAVFYSMGGTSTRIYVMLSNGSSFGASQLWYDNPGGWDWKRSKPVAGDFDHDGKTDIAVLYDQGGRGSRLWVLRSDGKAFHPAVWWTSAAGAFDWARTKVVAGDFTGDGLCDVGLLYDAGGNTMRFYVARSTGSAFAAPASWYYSGSGHWDARATKVAAGDLTGDGKADVAMLYDYVGGTSRLWVFKSTGSSLAIQSPAWYVSKAGGWDWNRVKMVAADITGDRKADMLMLYDYPGHTSKLWSFVSSGAGFSAIKTFWASAPGGWDWERARLGVADVDLDGKADALMLYDYGGATAKTWTFRSRGDGTSSACSLGWSSMPGGLDWNCVK